MSTKSVSKSKEKEKDNGDSTSSSSKSKTGGTFQVRAQNILGEKKMASGEGASIDNSLDATQVNRPIDAESFEDALTQLSKMVDSIPDGSKSYNIYVEEVKTGKRISATKETDSCISAIKQVQADMKGDKPKISPETPDEIVKREAREKAGKK